MQNGWRNDGALVARSLVEESGNHEVAFSFLAAAEAGFEQLVAMPATGVAREYFDRALSGVRMWRIAGLENYLIFYRDVLLS